MRSAAGPSAMAMRASADAWLYACGFAPLLLVGFLALYFLNLFQALHAGFGLFILECVLGTCLAD